MRQTPTQRPRFTLVELLVAMAIIVVLAAMLLPALGSARAKGREATCLNNLRECFLAAMVYTEDYDQYLPPNDYVYGPFGTCPQGSWDTVLAVANQYVPAREILHCPEQLPDTYEPGRVYGSFVRQSGNYEKRDVIPELLDVTPDRVFFLIDSVRASDWKEIWFFAHDGFGCWQRMHCRHNKAALAVLLDGHVDRFGRSELTSLRYQPAPEFRYGHWYIWDR